MKVPKKNNAIKYRNQVRQNYSLKTASWQKTEEQRDSNWILYEYSTRLNKSIKTAKAKKYTFN